MGTLIFFPVHSVKEGIAFLPQCLNPKAVTNILDHFRKNQVCSGLCYIYHNLLV